MGRLVTLKELRAIRARLRAQGKRVVFTNGTFDILHRGHVEYLAKARSFGDVLIVGLNTDASIRRIKGPGRPINPGGDRAAVLAALRPVDFICFFRSNTPAYLIAEIIPDVLVKGADWKRADIVGGDLVQRAGGTVRRVRLRRGRSTTSIIERVRRASPRRGRA